MADAGEGLLELINEIRVALQNNSLDLASVNDGENLSHHFVYDSRRPPAGRRWSCGRQGARHVA
jgi:hypothetical protein